MQNLLLEVNFHQEVLLLDHDLIKMYLYCKELEFKFKVVLQYWNLDWVEKIIGLNIDFECQVRF